VAQDQARQWLETPEARVVATTITYPINPDHLLAEARAAAADSDLPYWETPQLAEQYLRGLLQTCARDSQLRPDNGAGRLG
jgi:hypothetical protein